MTTSMTAFLDRGTGRIGYDVDGEGPLVVCIPGMGDLRSNYRELVTALVADGYRTAAFDLRGHGDSDVRFDSYDDVAAGRDALALVEQLGGPAVLVGSSMGAGAAVWAAAQRPDLVRGLVLLGPVVRDPQGAIRERATRALFAVLLTRPWGPFVWRTYLGMLYPARKSARFRAHREAVMASLRRPGRWAAFCATTRTSHRPATAALPRVRVPALIVMGTKDPDFADAAAEARWVGEALHGRVELIEGAGHYPHAEFPEQTLPAVLALVQEVFPDA